MPNALLLTKEEVVRRELASAIRLHFLAGGDPVAIYVLTSAANAVMLGVAAANGHTTVRDDLLILIKDEHHEDYVARLDEPFNFMKHGSKDPNETLATFNPDIVEVGLLLAVRDYGQIFGNIFFEITVFLAYMAHEKPDLVKQGGEIDRVLAMAKGVAGVNFIDRAAAAKVIQICDGFRSRGLIS